MTRFHQASSITPDSRAVSGPDVLGLERDRSCDDPAPLSAGLFVVCRYLVGCSTSMGFCAVSHWSSSGFSAVMSSNSFPPSSSATRGKVHGVAVSSSLDKCSRSSSRCDAGRSCSTQHLINRLPLTHQIELPGSREPSGLRFVSVANTLAGPKNIPCFPVAFSFVCFLQK